MSQTIQEKNKALVLEAFDTLFNKRDYAAAERYWSPNYIQHSDHIAPGREGLFDLIKSMPSEFFHQPLDGHTEWLHLCRCSPRL
jgi:predicted SnoaL-like aldol condensation-catalyzing enzyme